MIELSLLLACEEGHRKGRATADETEYRTKLLYRVVTPVPECTVD